MAKRKKIEEKKLSEERQKTEGATAEKILKLLALQTAVSSLDQEIEGLKKEFRVYVEENPVGLTPKGYKFWEGKTCGVELRDNPLHETDVNGLIAKIGLERTVKYLSVSRTSLVNDIEAGILPLTLEGLKEITKTDYGDKKVIPYYGQKNIRVVPK